MKKIKTIEDCELILQEIVKHFNNGEIYNGLNYICNIIKFQELLKIKTSFLNEKISYTPITIQRLWHILNNIKEMPVCTECGSEVNFISLKKGYSKTCSYTCSANPSRNKKLKQTNLNKYGVENPSQRDEIKEKKKKTKKENFGDENYNNRNKYKNTCIDKFGFENVFQNEVIKEKIKKSNLEKYGVEFFSQTEEYKEIYKKTSIERYGVEYPLQSKEIREKGKITNIKKYGVEHSSQNSDIKEKTLKNLFLKKYYTMPSGKIITIQGYENHTLDILLENHKEDDLIVSDKEIENIIGKIWYFGENNKKHRYYPDLYCISENKIYETKSDYTFLLDLCDNKLKMEACKKNGIDFVFYIFNKKRQLLNEEEVIKSKKPE